MASAVNIKFPTLLNIDLYTKILFDWEQQHIILIIFKLYSLHYPVNITFQSATQCSTIAVVHSSRTSKNWVWASKV